MNFTSDILPLKNRLYRLALRITLNAQEAEDIVQETLIKVWNRRESLDAIDSVEAFSMTICRNLSLDIIKKRDRMNVSLDAMPLDRPDNTHDPLQQLTQKDNLQIIKKLMDAMPEKHRTCMQLRDFEGKSYREIANIMNITEEQVKVNIFRARKNIKENFPKK